MSAPSNADAHAKPQINAQLKTNASLQAKPKPKAKAQHPSVVIIADEGENVNSPGGSTVEDSAKMVVEGLAPVGAAEGAGSEDVEDGAVGAADGAVGAADGAVGDLDGEESYRAFYVEIDDVIVSVAEAEGKDPFVNIAEIPAVLKDKHGTILCMGTVCGDACTQGDGGTVAFALHWSVKLGGWYLCPFHLDKWFQNSHVLRQLGLSKDDGAEVLKGAKLKFMGENLGRPATLPEVKLPDKSFLEELMNKARAPTASKNKKRKRVVNPNQHAVAFDAATWEAKRQALLEAATKK